MVTRSGQAATLESIREITVPTEYEPPELPNSVGTGTTLIDLASGQAGQNRGTTPVTPAHPTAFETTNEGCTMEVLPQIGEDGRIVEVALKPQIRRFDGFINYGSPISGSNSTAAFGLFGGVLTGGNFGTITENQILMPVFSTIRADSTLTILDGETVVMGGLLAANRTKVEDKTPILSDIPLVGRLFESNAYTSVRDAYVILVTVRLQDPAGEPVNRR
ncbi:MAG: type II and III secretion system protein [Akkermansiaceae bacterium]|nr:type II and III secretion system protein [Akkermansiaceae bacterium]